MSNLILSFKSLQISEMSKLFAQFISNKNGIYGVNIKCIKSGKIVTDFNFRKT